MRTLPACRKRRSAGFTLVELMVAVVVVTILIAIAVPSYSNSVRKSRRTEAKTALLDLASREERFLSTNGAYTNDSGNLGFASSTGSSTYQVTVGSGYYQVSVCVAATIPGSCGASQAVGTGATYLLTAAPIGAQAKDTTCGTFTLDNTGAQGAAATSGCW
jgi:type IV pilus assembly protein PilE